MTRMPTLGDDVLSHLVHTIQSNRTHLSELDGATGDGDHGINMAKGAAFAAEAARARPDLNLQGALTLLGDTLMTQIGGSMGPLYGSFFLGLARAVPDGDEFAADSYAAMLSHGVAEMRQLTTAQQGDKTILDALLPAEAAAREAASRGASLPETIDAATAAAEAGAQDTATIPARIGRAARVGDRSIGHIDAGAASCALVLRSLGDTIARHANGESS